MESDLLPAISSHWDFIDEVSLYLLDLFNSVRHGEKAWKAAERLSGARQKSWSPQLHLDLIQAAKILASAWKFRGETSSIDVRY